MQHPKPWLRFVEARKIEDQTLDIDGMKVRNDAGDKLGKVDGMIVDAESGRTYYVVVDAGGWFKSKQFLLPIGEVRLDGDRDALVVGLTKEQVERFPGFDTSEFDGLSASDIKRINDETCRVFQPNSVYPQDEPYYAAWNRASYQYPDWWNTEPTLAERMGGTVYEKEAEYRTHAGRHGHQARAVHPGSARCGQRHEPALRRPRPAGRRARHRDRWRAVPCRRYEGRRGRAAPEGG